MLHATKLNVVKLVKLLSLYTVLVSNIYEIILFELDVYVADITTHPPIYMEFHQGHNYM